MQPLVHMAAHDAKHGRPNAVEIFTEQESAHTASLIVANEDTGSVLTQQRAKACVAERALAVAIAEPKGTIT